MSMFYCHERQAKVLLGVPEAFRGHMPPDFSTGEVVISGITVWVEPSNKGPKGKSRFGHRVKAACPFCHKVTSYGRIHQHMKVHGTRMGFRYDPTNP
jgi:hypothetical protein